MSVQKHRFYFRQEIVVFVEVTPPRLHHADFGVGEMMHGSHQEIGRRNEIRVEDGHQFTGGGFEPGL